jgi:hypothetical protein
MTKRTREIVSKQSIKFLEDELEPFDGHAAGVQVDRAADACTATNCRC